MATIDNLSIQVTASADEASRALNRLASSASRLQGAARSAAGGAADLAGAAMDAGMATKEAGAQSGAAQKSTKDFGKAAKDAGENAKKGTAGISSFWQALKRVAFYRFIRTIIRSIGQAFKEGAQNLYQWSRATGLSDFAKNMDRIASSVLYLKNSLGAMLEPIVRILTPIIEWVVDAVVKVINLINQFFAMLSGSQTYTVAKKVATTWADAGKQAASSAKKAADDIRRTILGFDEINKLEKQNTTSYGSNYGTSSDTNNNADMFEQKKLTGWMSTIATWISNSKTNIPTVLAAILASFEAIKKVVQTIAEKTKGWIEDLVNLGKKAIEVPVSLVRKGWSTITEWCKSFGVATLSVAVAISTTAQSLWNTLKVAWGSLTDLALNVYFKIATTAKSLWTSLQVGWGSLANSALNVYLSLATTAKSLWKSLQVAWGSLPDLALNVYLKLATAAKDLWKSLQVAWGSLKSSALNVYLSLATTAKSLWTSLQVSWGKIKNHVLSVYLSLVTTAETLWGDLQTAWNGIADRVLGVSVVLTPIAKSLWTKLQTAWNGLADRVLSVSVVLTPVAKSLWTKLQTAWNGISEKVLGINVKIGTALKPLWEGLKLNWEKLALGALGIAVGIVTPWETIAAALGGLWGNVLGSFGGALGFAVAPILNKTPGEIQKELQEQMKPISPVIVYSTMAYKSVESAVGDTVNVVVKAVNAAGTELKNSWDLISNGLKWSLEVPMLINGEPGTGFIDHLSGTNKYTLSGITDANVTVNGKYNKAGSSPEANAALSGGSFDKKVSMSFDTSGLTSSYGDFTVDDSGITGATSSITGLINAFNAIKDGAKKILKVGVQSDGTPDQTTSTALTFKSGLKKALRVSVAKSGSINSTVGNAVDAPVENYKTVNVGIGADNKNSDSTAVKAVKNIGSTAKLSIKAVITSVLAATSFIASLFGIKMAAIGGVFSNGIWSNIPQYAGGTTNAHGSLFMAGEAGPELVGHAGGRTEVLNKSQLAATMYSAVRNAMSGVTLDANFYNGTDSESDYNTMFKAMYDAFTAALAQSNERDREKVALLRTISEKEFTAEVSTASINQAQTRMNRRAGTTIVAVGT